MTVINLPRSGGTVLITRTVAALTTLDEESYWSKIAIFSYSTCIRRPCCRVPVRIFAVTFVVGKKAIILWLVATDDKTD